MTSARSRIALLLAGGATAAAVVVLLLPTHPERGLFRLLAAVLPRGAVAGGTPLWWALESAGNVALFVPVGVVAAALLGARRGLPVAVAVSALCELAQAFIPERHASLSDVVLNAAGAAIGVALVVLVRRRRAARQATRA